MPGPEYIDAGPAFPPLFPQKIQLLPHGSHKQKGSPSALHWREAAPHRYPVHDSDCKAHDTVTEVPYRPHSVPQTVCRSPPYEAALCQCLRPKHRSPAPAAAFPAASLFPDPDTGKNRLPHDSPTEDTPPADASPLPPRYASQQETRLHPAAPSPAQSLPHSQSPWPAADASWKSPHNCRSPAFP